MTDWFGKVFFTLYPSKPKQLSTHEGKRLRTHIGVFMLFHMMFFVTSLTAVGFLPMLTELGFVIWTFSCYLTLREWEIILYLVALSCAAIYGLLNLFANKNISNNIIIGILMQYRFAVLYYE